MFELEISVPDIPLQSLDLFVLFFGQLHIQGLQLLVSQRRILLL